MKSLDHDPQVIQLASELGLNWKADPVNQITAYCAKKIAAWIKPFESAITIDGIQRIVCSKRGLVFEEFRSWQELEAIIEKYVSLGDRAFAALHNDFSNPAIYATLMRRANPDPRAHDQYVAVIDCRGMTEARRSFSKWHEIAHLLTLRRQLQFPYHRSTMKRDPMERLMDIIAGEIAFYPPLFEPLIRGQIKRAKGLTFQVVEEVRQQFCPTASFHSTLIACAKLHRQPTICLEAGMCLKNAEQAQLNSRQAELFAPKIPRAKLRILAAVPNAAARARKLGVHYHMAVPDESVISRALQLVSGTDVQGRENLGVWRHSDGTALRATAVTIEARRVGDTVIGLLIAA
jgi:hypothetical protein